MFVIWVVFVLPRATADDDDDDDDNNDNNNNNNNTFSVTAV